jgi:hypothetical protein
VPTPAQILGYDIGARFTPQRAMMRYIERIAAASTRVKVDTVARTFEGREMLIITISSEANMARLAEIQRDAARIADPRGANAGDIDAAVKRIPSIVWLEHSVHGGEASGAEAGLALLYQLAAGHDADTKMALDNAGSWPGPRTSHYYFDLNRDWYAQSHPETKGRVSTYMKWWPQVAVDLHEQGSSSSFYFATPRVRGWRRSA